MPLSPLDLPIAKLLLIVDDSDVVRKVASHLMLEFGYDPIDAEHGDRALELCKAGMPHTIFVDWQMPGMTGIELISSIRLQPGGADPFIVYCTTENDPADIAKALAAGANDYMLKPYDRETLYEKFRTPMAA